MRWKYVIPTIVVLAAVLIFNIFFFDMLLKKGLVAAGQAAFGAKVEIASLHTKLTKLAINIQGVQVADRNQPMSNLFQVEAIRFSVMPVPLLSKKFVINEMVVEGVRWGTARKTSGALPPKKQKMADARQTEGMTAKLMAKLEAKSKAEIAGLPAWDNIQKARDQFQNLSVDKMINPADLQCVKELDAIKIQYQQKAADYDGKLKALDVNAKLQSAQPVFAEIGAIKINNAQDALAAKTKLENARNKLQELQQTVKQVQELKKQADTDFGQSQQLVGRINALKDQDMKNLGDKFKLPTLSYENIARSLVGPVWMSKVNNVLRVIALVRQYMPAKKPKTKKVVKQHLRGVDVSFPVAYMPPDLHIKVVKISGSTGGEGKTGEPIDFVGMISDITSDSELVGRPTKAEIRGQQNGQAINLVAIFDHTQEIPVDSVEISLEGMSAAALKMPPSEYLPSFEQGKMAVTTKVVVTGEALAAELQVVLTELGAPKPAAESNADVQSMIQALWSNIPAINVKAGMKSQADDLSFTMSSNLDAILGERMKGLVGGKLAELQQKLRQEMDKQVAAKQKEVMDQFGQYKQQVLGRIGSDEKQTQDKLNGFQNQIKQKENEAGSVVEQQKKQAEDQLKNKAQEQLKGLFGR